MDKAQVEFSLINLEDIPGRPPVTPIASDRKGSQWDDALNALRRHGGTKGIRVPATDEKTRGRLKATLQTISKTHAIRIKVLDDKRSTAFFASVSEDGGRFSGPSRSN